MPIWTLNDFATMARSGILWDAACGARFIYLSIKVIGTKLSFSANLTRFLKFLDNRRHLVSFLIEELAPPSVGS